MERTKSMVIIPAYDPDETLLQLVEELAVTGNQAIVVDDGSKSECRHIFDDIKDRCIVLHHKQNFGKGAAIKTALQYISNRMPDIDTIGIMDADGQHRVDDMIRLLDFSGRTREALCLGVRSVGKDMPLKSRMGNTITRTVFDLVTRTRVSDTQTGLRAFDRALLPEFLSVEGNRYEYEMNMLLCCSKNQIEIRELAIETIYHDAQNSCSHFRAFQDSVRIYKDIIKFTASSMSSFLLDYLLFAVAMVCMPHTAVTVVAANVIARAVSAFYNYSMNCRYVFRIRRSAEGALQYFLLAAAILFLNNVVLSFFTQVAGIPVYYAKLATECILFLASWTVQKYVIFNNKKMSSQRG